MNSKILITLLGLSSALMACAPEMNSANFDSSEADHLSVVEGTDFVQRDADTNEIILVREPGDHANSQLHEKYTYLTGTPRKWAGTVNWSYNPAGQPSFLNTNEVVNALIAATKQWEAVSGVRFQYLGQTGTAASFSTCDRNTVVGWGPLTNSTVGYTQACFSSSTFTEFDMLLDNRSGSFVSTLSRIQQVSVHEFGHAVGLGHTDINPAIMTAVLSTANLVQDDIDGIRSLYGAGTAAPAPTPTPVPIATPVPTPTPTPTPTSTPAASWVYCANEGQTCNFSGTRSVRYGANGAYRTKTVTGTVGCNNATFGDPIPGIVKQCHYSTTVQTVSPTPTPAPTPAVVSWTACAQENQFCGFDGTKKVRYGANGVYVQKTVTGGIACNNATFGDPIPGVFKRCEFTSSL